MHAVHVLSVEEVRAAEGVGERILAFRYADDVYVVGHQAIGEHVEAVLVALLLQQREVYPPVVVVPSTARRIPSWRLFPRWVTWCSRPGMTIRATRGMM